jgi:hypothetical protein
MPDDPRGGAEHARDFYDSLEFPKTAVKLYSAGVSWRGAKVFGWFDDEEETRPIGEVNEDELREALPSWFIDGRTTITVGNDLPIRLVPEGEGTDLELLTPPATSNDDGGLTLLWPACTNIPTIKEQLEAVGQPGPMQERAQLLLRELILLAYQHLHIPEWAYDGAKTASAGVSDVTQGLFWYRQSVNEWREAMARSLKRELRPYSREIDGRIRDVFVQWNEEWATPSGDGWVGVYEAFAACGLRLSTFASEYRELLNQQVTLGLKPRRVLDYWTDK